MTKTLPDLVASLASAGQPGETGKLTSQWITVNGLRMHMQVSSEPVPPERLPVVMVHGLAVSSRYMIPVSEHLAPHYQVYAPDLPGFGRSEEPDHILDVPELADALLAWIQAMRLERATFIGNSMGCQIIVDFATRYPECIAAGVLIAPTMDRYARTMRQQFWRLTLDTIREPVTQPFVVLYDYFMFGLRRTLATLRYALADLIEAKLPHVQAPMLVVRGERDPIVSQRWAEEVTHLLPNGRLVVFPHIAHTANYAAPNEMLQIVQPLFDGVMD